MCGSVPVVCPTWYKQNPKIRGFRHIFAWYVVRIWVFPFDSNAVRRFVSPRQKSHASVNADFWCLVHLCLRKMVSFFILMLRYGLSTRADTSAIISFERGRVIEALSIISPTSLIVSVTGCIGILLTTLCMTMTSSRSPAKCCNLCEMKCVVLPGFG